MATKLGQTRRHTRDGNRRTDRENRPLAPSTLDGVLAALRRAHLTNGLPWFGYHPRIKEALRGYATTSTHTPSKAAALTPDHLDHLFRTTPTHDTPATTQARARAVATALDIPLATLHTLDSRSLHTTDDTATLTIHGIGTRTTRCLLTQVDDPIAAAACAHCHLRAWAEHSPHTPFIEPHKIAPLRNSARRLGSALPRAHFAEDRLTVDDLDLWTTIALGIDKDCALWIRMRAALLPMFATGLRLDDIDGLAETQVALPGRNATLSIQGKTEPGARPFILTLVPEGGPLCPVAAMRHYDAWVRAYLPQRTRWTPPFGHSSPSNPLGIPRDADITPGSRALYQAARLWMLQQGLNVAPQANRRSTLTPHSARHGFAQHAEANGATAEEISAAMRHKRPDTTATYLGKASDTTADHLLSKIAKDQDPR